MTGLARALVIARECRSISTLCQTHGLKDISAHNCRIEDLTVAIQNRGTFLEFNSVVRQLNRFCYLGEFSKRHAVNFPTARSNDLVGLEVTLKAALSRVPGLNDLYRTTFGEDPLNAQLTVLYWPDQADYCDLSVYTIDNPVTDHLALRELVRLVRQRFPFLNDWYLHSSNSSSGKTTLDFANLIKPDGLDDISENHLRVSTGVGFITGVDELRDPSRFPRFPFLRVLDPLAGGMPGGAHSAVSPYSGHFISEFSNQYLIMFLLSSLVRYRPQTWTRAISRTSISGVPSDDHVLAIIEYFLDLNATSVPQMIVTALNPHEDEFA